jgi:hypothetical protein
MKKYACSIVNITLYSVGGDPISNLPIIEPAKIETILPPPNMVVNRVTFQAFTNMTGTLSIVLLNVRPMQLANDGILLVVTQDAINTIQPATYTFENFNGEAIENAFYMANVGVIAEPTTIQVIFEGYEK